MSHRRNQRNDDPPYAEEFKPARILGGPRIEEMVNNVSLGLQHERFNEHRDRLVYFDNPTKKDEDTRSVFNLTIKDVDTKPIIHPVEVIDVNEQYDLAYAIEPETGARGITIVLIKNTMNKDNEVYVNLYDLPFSTLSQILSNCSSTPIGVKVKQDERIKLQITIRPSATGEPTYKTHDTEVTLSQVGDEETNHLKNRLQFLAAKNVAHLISQVIHINPKEKITPETRLHHQLFSISLKADQESRKGLDPTSKAAIVTAGFVTVYEIVDIIDSVYSVDVENRSLKITKAGISILGAWAATGAYIFFNRNTNNNSGNNAGNNLREDLT